MQTSDTFACPRASGSQAAESKRVRVPRNVWILGIYKIGEAILGSVFGFAVIMGSSSEMFGILGMNFLVGRLQGMFLQTVLSWDMFARCA